MKAMNKILATLMCLSLLFGCISMAVFADDTATGSITVQDQSGTNATVAGKTLNLFKIFDATSSGSNISYNWIVDTVGSETVNRYEGFFYGETIPVDGGEPVVFPRLIAGTSEPSINDVVAYINGLKDDSFGFSQMAASLHEYIHTKGVEDYLDDTSDEIDAKATSYTFTTLSLGYYMIYDATEIAEDSPAVRSAAMLAHPGENKVIELKADRPHIVKYVNDNHGAGDPSWQLGTTASVGDTVTFRIVTAIPDHDLYGENYTFVITDEMADELALVDNSVKVTITPPATVNEDDISPTAVSYDVSYDETAPVDFKVTLNNITDLPTDTLVEIVYEATVTAQAKAHNVNTATLTYSNDPNKGSSTGAVEASASVSVWQLTLTKYLEDTNGTPSFMRLAGAEFEIYKVDGSAETLLKFSGDETTSKYVFDQTSGTITTLKTLNTGEGNTDVGYTDGGNLGQLLIFGLGEGTYRIKETKAPDGYQQADNPFEFTLVDTIGQAGAVANAEISQVSPEGPGQFTRVHVDEAAMKYYLGVTNAPGSALPETGGMGTTFFTILGIVLMAGAVAFFTSRKRSSMA